MTAAPPPFKLRWSPEPSAAPAHPDDVAALEALGFSRAGRAYHNDTVDSPVWQAADHTALASPGLLFGIRVVTFTSLSADGRAYDTVIKDGYIPFPGIFPLSHHAPAPPPNLLQRRFDYNFPFAYALPNHGAWCDVLDDVTVEDGWRQHLAQRAALGFAPAPLEGVDAATLGDRTQRHVVRLALVGPFLRSAPLFVWAAVCTVGLAIIVSSAALPRGRFAAEVLRLGAVFAGGWTGLFVALRVSTVLGAQRTLLMRGLVAGAGGVATYAMLIGVVLGPDMARAVWTGALPAADLARGAVAPLAWAAAAAAAGLLIGVAWTIGVARPLDRAFYAWRGSPPEPADALLAPARARFARARATPADPTPRAAPLSDLLQRLGLTPVDVHLAPGHRFETWADDTIQAEVHAYDTTDAVVLRSRTAAGDLVETRSLPCLVDGAPVDRALTDRWSIWPDGDVATAVLGRPGLRVQLADSPQAAVETHLAAGGLVPSSGSLRDAADDLRRANPPQRATALVHLVGLAVLGLYVFDAWGAGGEGPLFVPLLMGLTFGLLAHGHLASLLRSWADGRSPTSSASLAQLSLLFALLAVQVHRAPLAFLLPAAGVAGLGLALNRWALRRAQ
jgi:hypothetical protein